MGETASRTAPGEATSEAQWLALVRRQVESLRFGVVQITVHERRVTQIDKTERVRLDKPTPDFEI